MKYLVTESKTRKEKEQLEEMGLYCYDLRDSDFSNDIASIEKYVFVNNIGSMITNKEIKLGDKYPDDFVDYNTFVDNENNVCVSSIKELLEKDKIKNNDRGR